MSAKSSAARTIGVLLIIHMAGSAIVNFAMEAPLFAAPGFLVNAASHSRQIGLAVLLGLVTEMLWIGIAVTAFPIFIQHTRKMALWFVALAVVCLAVAVVENIGVMSMVSLSEAYTKASAVEREQLQMVQVAVSSPRNWAHFMGRMFAGGATFVFYAVLYRFSLIPRAISGFGLIAAVLMVTALAMPLFGYDVVFPMLAPAGLSQLILSVWLLTKGFRVQPGAREVGS